MTEKSAELVEYSVTNTQLADLAAKYPVVPDASSADGYQAIKACLSEIRPLRTAVEKRRKELKKDAIAYGKKVDGEARRITSALLDIETPFRDAKVAEDGKAEKAAQEAQEAEQQRILAIQGRIADIHKQSEGLLNATSDEITARITAVLDFDMDSFEEFGAPAYLAKNFVLDSLKKAREERVDFEEKQAEQKRIEVEQAEKQAELDKQAEVQRKEMEAQQAELAAQQKKVDEERQEAARVMKEAQDKAETEKKRVAQEKADAERKEREKAEQEAAALKAQEEKKREERRQEMLRPDKDILRDWVNKLRFIDAPAGLNDPLIMSLARDVMDSLTDLAARTTEKMERI